MRVRGRAPGHPARAVRLLPGHPPGGESRLIGVQSSGYSVLQCRDWDSVVVHQAILLALYSYFQGTPGPLAVGVV